MSGQLDLEELTGPAIDRAAVRALAEQMVAVTGDKIGDFCLATISGGNVQHHTVPNGPDAAKRIVATVERISVPHHNVYFSAALFRSSSIADNQGRTERNVIGVLASVADFDGKHEPTSRRERLPQEPSSEVETSAGNFQCHFWNDRSYSTDEAKPVQEALSQSSGADGCKSTEHLWRVPGTYNWPTENKIKAGRSATPFLARWSKEPEAYDVLPLDTLRASIIAKYPDAFEAKRAKGEASAATGEPVDPATLREALGYLDPNAEYPEWRDNVAAIGAANCPEARQIAHDWSEGKLDLTGRYNDARPSRYTGPEAVDLVLDTMPPKEGGLGVGTIAARARKEGWQGTFVLRRPLEERFAEAIANIGTEAGTALEVVEGEIDSSVNGSQDDIAIQYARGRSRVLKFIPEIKKWVAFDGHRWKEVSQPAVWNDILPLARSCAASFASESVRRQIASRATVANVEALARGNPRFFVPLADWDADPWLLNTGGKIVDLRTGKQRDTEPSDYCMKSTAVEAAPEGIDFREACPRWLSVLDRITAGDAELQGFLQRVFGYCLTGVTTEHAAFFGYGTGANGKGVVTNTMTRILGDYSKIAPVDMFTASHNERHPTDMAMLRGARLVAAQETEEGRQWAEAKIKALTGGDPITARFMHQDFFEYTPQFKLFIAGNHKPKLRNVDEAMRRRLHLVPFTVTIPEAERDPDLQEKLKAEWPAILRWAIEGCLAWQKAKGLKPPAAVQAATSEYFSDQDPLETWLAERCTVGAKGWTASADLYGDYRAHYHAENGTDCPDGRKQFSQRLESHGFQRRTSGKAGNKGFAGITLMPAAAFRSEDEF